MLKGLFGFLKSEEKEKDKRLNMTEERQIIEDEEDLYERLAANIN
jgi:hypothetical protein